MNEIILITIILFKLQDKSDKMLIENIKKENEAFFKKIKSIK